MSTDVIYVTTPVGRLVWGSVSVPKTKDSNGNLKVHKKGPNMGQPAPSYEFGLAVPKGAETHWNQTELGRQIWAAAVAAWPGGQYNARNFSWKVTDGDSTELTVKGKPAPCTRQGHPGHWVFAFSSSFAPELLDSTGKNRVDPATIKLGYYIQVAGSIKGSNGNNESPGIYLNSKFVSFQGFGPEIVHGPDPSKLGFGLAQLPVGASVAPVASTFVPPAQTPAAVTPPPVVTAAPPAPPALPVVVPVVPHTAILTPPAPPAGPQMTAKAGGATLAQFLAAGWTEAALIAEGYMVRP